MAGVGGGGGGGGERRRLTWYGERLAGPVVDWW